MQPAPGARSKPRNWKDVQLIISSISLAISLGLWSMWATRQKEEAAAPTMEPTFPPTEESTATPEPMVLLPGQILYLSTPSAQTTAPPVSQEQPRRRKGDKGEGGGGGGGGGGNADAGTGSS